MTIRFIVALVAISCAYAPTSLHFWNPKKRPPISLERAQKIAEQLLGEDAANRYCVSVSLYGNSKGDGKEGAWNLLYAAEDGSRKHVFIDMKGDGNVKPWNGALNWDTGKSRRKDLDEIEAGLRRTLEKHGIVAAIDRQPDELTVKYKVRSYLTYPWRDDAYQKEPIETEAPDSGGFVIRCQIVGEYDRSWPDYYSDQPYWSRYRGVHLLEARDVYVNVEVLEGPGVPTNLLQPDELFGDDTNNR